AGRHRERGATVPVELSWLSWIGRRHGPRHRAAARPVPARDHGYRDHPRHSVRDSGDDDAAEQLLGDAGGIDRRAPPQPRAGGSGGGGRARGGNLARPRAPGPARPSPASGTRRRPTQQPPQPPAAGARPQRDRHHSPCVGAARQAARPEHDDPAGQPVCGARDAQRQQGQRPPAQPGHLLDSAARLQRASRLVVARRRARGDVREELADAVVPRHADCRRDRRRGRVSRVVERIPSMTRRTRAIVQPRRHEDTKNVLYNTGFLPSWLRGVCRRAAFAVSLALAAVAIVHAQQVTFDRILHADRDPQNWLTYSGSLFGHRYSPLTQITPANVKNLELQWVFQTRGPAEATEKFEATPLVVDGVMYTVLAPNHVVALDAASGRMFWMYSPRLS